MLGYATLLADMDWGRIGTGVMFLLFIVASVLLILTVLIQKPQGGGLAGAFGSGAGSGQTAFGARTGDALTVLTIIMFVFFLASGIALAVTIRPAKVDAQNATLNAKPGEKPADAPAEKPADKPADKPATDGTPAPAATPPVTGGTPAPAPTTNPAPVPAPVPADAPKPVDPPKPSGG